MISPDAINSKETESMEQRFSIADDYEPLFRRQLHCRTRGVNIYQPHALNEELKQFFGSSEPDLVRYTKTFPMWELPQIHYGLRACFSEAREVCRAGPPGRFADLWIACEQRIELRPGRFETFLASGTSFNSLSEGRRVVFIFEQDSDPITPEFVFSLIGARRDELVLKNKFEELDNWTQHNHYLSRQAIRPNGTLLNLGDGVTWDDVALPCEVRLSLEANITKVLQLREKFIAMGVPQKRGVLLSGPPGTGKTMIGKVLAGLGLATFVLFTAGDLERYGNIRAAFKLARRLRPTVLFIEDLDLIAVDRNSRCDIAVLGELLAQLDGVEENDGLIVVATTNDLSAIEPAIANRPSRFDVVLEIGLPATTERHRILTKHIGRLVEPPFLDEMAERTAGYSGAQVREVAYQVVQEALVAEDGNDVHRQRVDGPSVRRIFDQIVNKKAKLGFTVRENNIVPH